MLRRIDTANHHQLQPQRPSLGANPRRTEDEHRKLPKSLRKRARLRNAEGHVGSEGKGQHDQGVPRPLFPQFLVSF